MTKIVSASLAITSVSPSQKVYNELIIPESLDELRKKTDYPILDAIMRGIRNIRQMAAPQLGRRGNFDDYQIVLLLLTFKFMRVVVSVFDDEKEEEKRRKKSHEKKRHLSFLDICRLISKPLNTERLDKYQRKTMNI